MSDLRDKTRNRFNKEQPLINSMPEVVNNSTIKTEPIVNDSVDLREKTLMRMIGEDDVEEVMLPELTADTTIQLPTITVNAEEPPTFADILYKTAVNMGYIGSQKEFEKDFSSISKIDDMTINGGIQGITLGTETTLIEQAGRIVDIPVATNNSLGVIKGSSSGVLINSDGTLNIQKVRASTLYADTNEDKVYWECGNSFEEG